MPIKSDGWIPTPIPVHCRTQTDSQQSKPTAVVYFYVPPDCSYKFRSEQRPSGQVCCARIGPNKLLGAQQTCPLGQSATDACLKLKSNNVMLQRRNWSFPQLMLTTNRRKKTPCSRNVKYYTPKQKIQIIKKHEVLSELMEEHVTLKKVLGSPKGRLGSPRPPGCRCWFCEFVVPKNRDSFNCAVMKSVYLSKQTASWPRTVSAENKNVMK